MLSLHKLLPVMKPITYILLGCLLQACTNLNAQTTILETLVKEQYPY